ncbi:MAG: hypothetical protein ACOYMB_04180 [Patescibacteria group bacterium]
MKGKNKTLAIIAGAAGEIGTEFCKSLVNRRIDCLAVIRNRPCAIELGARNFSQVVCDLENPLEVKNVFGKIDLESYKKIIFIHAIGTDRFEPRGYPIIRPLETIPSDVYRTNVNSFKYLLRFLTNRLDEWYLDNRYEDHPWVDLKAVIIAGEADKYAPFVIESFCEAKFINRGYLHSFLSILPGWFSGLSVNITSTITRSACLTRPFADTRYWLTPQEVVSESIEEIIFGKARYKEISIIKPSPDFTEDYYRSDKMLYEKWSEETGIR